MSSYKLEVRAAATNHPKPAVEQPCEAGLLLDEGEEVAHAEGVKGAGPKFLGRVALQAHEVRHSGNRMTAPPQLPRNSVYNGGTAL